MDLRKQYAVHLASIVGTDLGADPKRYPVFSDFCPKKAIVV